MCASHSLLSYTWGYYLFNYKNLPACFCTYSLISLSTAHLHCYLLPKAVNAILIFHLDVTSKRCTAPLQGMMNIKLRFVSVQRKSPYSLGTLFERQILLYKAIRSELCRTAFDTVNVPLVCSHKENKRSKGITTKRATLVLKIIKKLI